MSRCKTYRMPCRHSPSGTGFGTGDRSGQGGNNVGRASTLPK